MPRGVDQAWRRSCFVSCRVFLRFCSCCDAARAGGLAALAAPDWPGPSRRCLLRERMQVRAYVCVGFGSLACVFAHRRTAAGYLLRKGSWRTTLMENARTRGRSELKRDVRMGHNRVPHFRDCISRQHTGALRLPPLVLLAYLHPQQLEKLGKQDKVGRKDRAERTGRNCFLQAQLLPSWASLPTTLLRVRCPLLHHRWYLHVPSA